MQRKPSAGRFVSRNVMTGHHKAAAAMQSVRQARLRAPFPLQGDWLLQSAASSTLGRQVPA